MHRRGRTRCSVNSAVAPAGDQWTEGIWCQGRRADRDGRPAVWLGSSGLGRVPSVVAAVIVVIAAVTMVLRSLGGKVEYHEPFPADLIPLLCASAGLPWPERRSGVVRVPGCGKVYEAVAEGSASSQLYVEAPRSWRIRTHPAPGRVAAATASWVIATQYGRHRAGRGSATAYLYVPRSLWRAPSCRDR